jgi:hypothetical protein
MFSLFIDGIVSFGKIPKADICAKTRDSLENVMKRNVLVFGALVLIAQAGFVGARAHRYVDPRVTIDKMRQKTAGASLVSTLSNVLLASGIFSCWSYFFDNGSNEASCLKQPLETIGGFFKSAMGEDKAKVFTSKIRDHKLFCLGASVLVIGAVNYWLCSRHCDDMVEVYEEESVGCLPEIRARPTCNFDKELCL